jgi:hypothetical protein
MGKRNFQCTRGAGPGGVITEHFGGDGTLIEAWA